MAQDVEWGGLENIFFVPPTAKPLDQTLFFDLFHVLWTRQKW